jgi:hypothetical protein
MTKGEILTVLNARLKRAETDISTEIKAALAFVSAYGLFPCLHTSTSPTLAAAAKYLAHPTGFNTLDYITLNDGTYDSQPLDEASWEDILRWRAETTSTGEPLSFCDRGSNFEMDCGADTAYTATIYYWRNHPDQETILFGNEFAEALYNLTMAFYLRGKGIDQYTRADYLQSLAIADLARLPQDVKTSNAKYKDL